MNTEKALEILTEENIRIATKVAIALDSLQRFEFKEQFEQIVPAICESKMIQICEDAVKDHVTTGFGANGYGVMLNSSTLLTLTAVLGLEEASEIVASEIAVSKCHE